MPRCFFIVLGNTTSGSSINAVMQQKIIVICGPSGTGKNKVINKLIQKGLPLEHSISTTTRKPRHGEVHDKDYYCLTHEDFIERINKNEFIEYAQLLDHYYGTSIQEIERIRRNQRIPILDIDVQGALQIKNKTENVITLFIAPPSLEELEKRLLSRNTETMSEIQKRLALAKEELTQKDLFDHVIINDQLDKAVEEINDLIKKFYD